MSKSKKESKQVRFGVSVSFDKDSTEAVDAVRGDVSRSRWIERAVLEKLAKIKKSTKKK